MHKYTLLVICVLSSLCICIVQRDIRRSTTPFQWEHHEHMWRPLPSSGLISFGDLIHADSPDISADANRVAAARAGRKDEQDVQVQLTLSSIPPVSAFPGISILFASTRLFECCLSYRGGRICLDAHFAPLWNKNAPRFGIAHALALGVSQMRLLFPLQCQWLHIFLLTFGAAFRYTWPL